MGSFDPETRVHYEKLLARSGPYAHGHIQACRDHRVLQPFLAAIRAARAWRFFRGGLRQRSGR